MKRVCLLPSASQSAPAGLYQSPVLPAGTSKGNKGTPRALPSEPRRPVALFRTAGSPPTRQRKKCCSPGRAVEMGRGRRVWLQTVSQVTGAGTPERPTLPLPPHQLCL